MKKYQYLASWDDQTLTRVGEPVVVLGDSNVSQVEVILPSNFLLDPTEAVARMYFLLPGEKESGFETLETATKDENGDSHVTWTIKHVHSQKGGRLAFSLTLIGDDAQWDSRTAIIPVYESRYQPESEEAEEPYTGRLDALEGSMAAIRGEFDDVVDDFEELKETATLGTPIPESLVTNMQEGHVYIYTGTEPGYTAGHVYYYVNGTLTDGGQYGGTTVDATLTVSGAAADAKVVGDEIAEIKEDLGENSSLAAEYSASSTYAVGAYVLYDGTIYQCNTPITIAEAWTAAHWTAKDVSSVLADANARLDMLATMQEVQEDEPVEGIVQVVDLSKVNWTANSQGKYSGKLTDYIILKGDGDYYQNPYGVAVNESGGWRLLYARFYDAYNNQLTLTNVRNGSTQEYLTLFGGNAGHFTIENGRTLKYYQGETLTNTYTTAADIAKIMGNADFQYFDNDTTKFGITYGGKSASYVPYEGSAEPTYEYNYVPKMAEYVEKYMKAHGTAVDNNIFNYVHPEADNTEFVNAIKYYHSRKERENNNIVRIGTFNKYVSRGSTNYPVIKQELADYSLDMCGFQETDLTISDGVITNRIETALQGWQFPHGCDVSINTGKGFVSHWEILSSEALELLTTSRGVSYAIKCVVQLPEYKMYSNVINNKPTLSVYTYHGIAYNAEIDGVMTTSKQIRLMEISALLNFISEDTSDFIVIVGDTNAFESGFDIHTGTHEEWELFRQAGYTPVLSGEYSTVTADLAAKYFTLADNNKVYCIAAYDQVFIGQNISVVATNVVDSNLYPVEALGGAPVSDHCMVYADLKFDFDAIMQNKLKDIAVTEPWW